MNISAPQTRRRSFRHLSRTTAALPMLAASTLNCNKPLTFGVLRTQLLDLGVPETKWRGSANQPGQLPIFNQVAGPFGTATGVLTRPGQGECSVVGSVAPDDTSISISFTSGGSVTLDGVAVLGLLAATPNQDGLTVDRFRTVPSLSRRLDDETRFVIVADLVITNNLVAANFGGHTGMITITVEENKP